MRLLARSQIEVKFVQWPVRRRRAVVLSPVEREPLSQPSCFLILLFPFLGKSGAVAAKVTALPGKTRREAGRAHRAPRMRVRYRRLPYHDFRSGHISVIKRGTLLFCDVAKQPADRSQYFARRHFATRVCAWNSHILLIYGRG